jgi:hypothetical protein
MPSRTKRTTKAKGWSANLTRVLRLKNGRELVTLADAARCLDTYFSTVTRSASLARTIEDLMRAAETGKLKDRKAATDRVWLELRERFLL